MDFSTTVAPEKKKKSVHASKAPENAGGEKLDVSFGMFLRVGVVAMPLALGCVDAGVGWAILSSRRKQ
jgi:hypothetical protein